MPNKVNHQTTAADDTIPLTMEKNRTSLVEVLFINKTRNHAPIQSAHSTGGNPCEIRLPLRPEFLSHVFQAQFQQLLFTRLACLDIPVHGRQVFVKDLFLL